jgi:hypothetical protein
MATLAGLPGISVGLAVDPTGVAPGLRVAERQFRQFAQNTQRGTGAMRQGFQQLGFQIQDVVVSLQSGQAPLRVFIQQGTQIASAFGPVGAALGTAAALAVSLGAAFLSTGDSASAAAADVDKLLGKIDEMVPTVDAAVKAMRDLTDVQLRNKRLNLTGDMAKLQAEQDRVIRQIDDLVTRFGQLGAAEAGITQGTGDISQAMSEFLAGVTDVHEFAAEMQRLQGAVDNTDFDEFVEGVREGANELLAAELGAQRTANELAALDRIAAGATQTAEEQADAETRRAKALDKSAKSAQQLTDQQKRLQAAGKYLLETSAVEERYDREQERIAEIERQRELAVAEQAAIAARQAAVMARPCRSADPSIQDEFTNIFAECFG